ncbi:MAG: type II toxin-antitoxin system HicB family antitoxin [Bacteroidaceae bacterium]|nr:type II toxin-antitoxin system HicB family antitoxin [Bacteroidaceae bacterium]
MKHFTLEAQAHEEGNGAEYHFQLPFYVFPEDNAYVAYCPSLDIATSGKDYADAVKNFFECFQLHIEWCVENGTLLDDLKDHGWKVRKHSAEPPAFRTLSRKPEYASLIGGDKSYQRIVMPMRINIPVGV